MKGQISFPVKVVLIVVIVSSFLLAVYYYNSFVAEVKKEKEKINFETAVLSTLQKLVTDPECLAYPEKLSTKPVLDAKKLNEFSLKYKDKEPECAKAKDFDYYITVEQIPKNVSTYPSFTVESVCEGKLTWEISYEFYSDAINGYYLVCRDARNKSKKINITKGICRGCSYYGELDGNYPNYLGRCTNIYCDLYNCKEYTTTNLTKCYESIHQKEKVCCVFHDCTGGSHPWILKCYNLDPEKDCKKASRHFHMFCGRFAIPKLVTKTKTVNVSIEYRTWNFSVSSGATSFSPSKAKWDEIEISYPVTIRYNETFSAEGIIKLKAVRGELEKFVGMLEDICIKARKERNVYYAEKFRFSYNLKFKGNTICMLDSCKIVDCDFAIQAPEEIPKGEYYIKIFFDEDSNSIKVVK